MFDIGWTELMVIAMVAVLVVGPKDLPRMLRAFGRTVGQMKRMAGQFQNQFNEALREAELDDVKKAVESIGDPVGDIHRELQSDDKVGKEADGDQMKPITGDTPQAAEEPAKAGALPEADEPEAPADAAVVDKS